MLEWEYLVKIYKMEKSFRKRVRNIKKHLQFYINDEDSFYIGVPFDEYLKSPLLEKYGLPKVFENKKTFIPKPKGSITKVNAKGKYVRKKPEEKETVVRHISFVRKRDGRRIEYDRTYNIYVKELLHRFNSKLYFLINEHGEKLVLSEFFASSKSSEEKATHLANMFLEMFNQFEIYDSKMNPAIHFNTKFEKIILPAGTLEDSDNLDELIDIGKRFVRNEEDNKAYVKRLKVLTEFKPDIRGKGPNGFFGYIVFGFSELKIVILETMYAGNATYIFTTENFESNILQDKQSVLKSKLHLKRIFHDDNWETNLRILIESMQNK